MMRKESLVEAVYWNKNWELSELAQPIDISSGILKNPQNQRLHHLFTRFLSKYPAGTKLLEVGCANSNFLPYFANEYSFSVTGLDYSEKGCDQAKAILAREQVEGDIVCADMFKPPAQMHEAFDVVVSFGVIEHFTSTTKALAALNIYLRPGGTIITLIPNMNGLVGFLQKKVNREIYDLHVPINKKDLLYAHRKNALDCLCCDYFMFMNFYIINNGSIDNGPWFFFLKT